MPRKKLIEDELGNEHQLILNAMEEDKSYSPMEITNIFSQRYSENVQVNKWGASKGDLCRYVIVRYLTFLKNRGYVEPDPNFIGKWRKVRESPLLKEVADAYIFLGRASNLEEAILKLAKEFVAMHKTNFDILVKSTNEARRTIKKEKEAREKALLSAEQTLAKIAEDVQKKNEG